MSHSIDKVQNNVNSKSCSQGYYMKNGCLGKIEVEEESPSSYFWN